MGIIIAFLVLVFTITIHEFAHAWMADRLGDPTARLAGRLTLNPLAHLDPIGTVLLPLFTLLSGSAFFIGWAKPTPFDPFNLRNPKKDSALIALAGPTSNILLAILLSIILRLLQLVPMNIGALWLVGIIELFIQMNVILAIFNLIPIHPLDGFKVVAGLLPEKYYQDWLSLEQYGIIFLLLIIFPFFGQSPAATIISPIANIILSLLIPGGLGGTI